jgi:hypothetical protein
MGQSSHGGRRPANRFSMTKTKTFNVKPLKAMCVNVGFYNEKRGVSWPGFPRYCF